MGAVHISGNGARYTQLSLTLPGGVLAHSQDWNEVLGRSPRGAYHRLLRGVARRQAEYPSWIAVIRAGAGI